MGEESARTDREQDELEHPEHPAQLVDRADALLASGDAAAAVRAMEEALERDPTLREGHNWLGWYHLARGGDPGAFAFPTADGVRGLDFSFAGLKTSLLYKVRELGEAATAARRADLAASYQHAVVEQLARRAARALAETGLDRLAVGGGVAANGPLRERLAGLAPTVHVPARALCTDNAAMIGSAARFVAPVPFPDYLALEAYATGEHAL